MVFLVLLVFLPAFRCLPPVNMVRETEEYLKNPTYNLSCWKAVHLGVDGRHHPGCKIVRNGVNTFNDCLWYEAECSVDRNKQSDLDRAYCIQSFTVDSTGQNISIELQGASCYRATYLLAHDGDCGKKCNARIALGEKIGTYCCCTSPFCNRDYQLDLIDKAEEQKVSKRIGQIFVPLFILSLLSAVASVTLIRRRRLSVHDKLKEDGSNEEKELLKAKSLLNFDRLELKDVCGKGTFGQIYRAVYRDDSSFYAVKVIGTQDRNLWENEREIYRLMYTDKDAAKYILSFYGAEERKEEFWIVTGFHRNGSLFDYLSLHGFTRLKEVLHIASSIVCGLAFLHEQFSNKPPIAHRDFKSKNVILTDDLAARLADFGLAQVLDTNLGDIHSPVGTPRYMAPEVLEGAISFKPAAFLRIDMYAFALVLYELTVCCTDLVDESEIKSYELPFAFVGARPSVEEMKELVVVQQLRPCLPPSLAKSQAGRMLSETIKDCWDQDADARISISCVRSRFQNLLFPSAGGSRRLDP